MAQSPLVSSSPESPPVVTVIVPAYNAAAHIGDTLASSLAQTLRAIEVIVVDDGSTDATPEIVRRVADADARVRLISMGNRGVAAARNAAILEARGTYLAPLDADDLWYPDKLERQVERMERGGPAMGMVYSWWVSVDGEGRVQGASPPVHIEGRVAPALTYANFIGNASVPLYRREVVVRVGGYDPGLRARGAEGCEDWDLSLKVAAESLVGLAPGHLVGYRAVPGSMSSHVASMARSYYAVMDGVRATWDGLPPRLFRWSEGHFAAYLAGQSLDAGAFGAALRWARRAVRADPLYAFAPNLHRLTARALLGLAAPAAWRPPPPRPRRATRQRLDVARAGGVWPSMWPASWTPFDRIRTRRWLSIRTLPPPRVVAPHRPLAPPPARLEAYGVGDEALCSASPLADDGSTR